VQATSPPASGTPARPPALLRLPEQQTTASPSVQPSGREAVKRNLEAAAFVEPSVKRAATNGQTDKPLGNGAANGGGEQLATHSVASLNPYVNKFVIKVGI
jgi:hypothetical protein